MYTLGTGIAELAKQFGRNRGAIRSRLKKLGLKEEILEGSTYDQTRQFLEQGLSIDEITQKRGLARSTIAGHLERLIQSGEQLDLLPLMPPSERFEKVRAAFEETGGALLSPVKAILGDSYSYDEIRLVWLFLDQQKERPDRPAAN